MTRRFLLTLLATLSAVIAVIGVPIELPAQGLDPSWKQALVEATDQGWIFGRDLVFTYGPLHQLSTQQVSANLLPLLLGRVLYGAAWAGATSLIGLLGGLSSALILVVSIAIIPTPDALYYLLCAVGVLLAMAPLRPVALPSRVHVRFMIRQALLTLHATGIAIGILVKLSYAGAALPALTAMAWLSVIDVHRNHAQRQWTGTAAVIGIPSLAIILSWTVLVSPDPRTLFNYFTGPNLDIVLGYSDAMSYWPTIGHPLLIPLYALNCVLAALLLLLWLVPHEHGADAFRDSVRYRISSLITGLSLTAISWIAFKAGFVRDDSYHTMIGGFFALSLNILLATWIITENWNTITNIPSVFILPSTLLLPMIMAYTTLYPLTNRMTLAYAKQAWEVARLIVSPDRRQKLYATRQQSLRSLSKHSEDYGIPSGSTADIITLDITALLSNKLHYQPRPIPQSYSAYTQTLQKLNARFFALPEKRPDYVIVDLVEIDGRAPISLDSAALRQVLKSYVFSHRGSKGSLIFRRALPAPHQSSQGNNQEPLKHPRSTGSLAWKSPVAGLQQSNAIPIPTNHEPTYLTLDVTNSLHRSITSTLYRPLPVQIEYLDRDGKVVNTYRFIPRAGHAMLISPLITNNDELYRMVVKSNSPAPPASSLDNSRTPVSFRFASQGTTPPFRRGSYLLHP